MGLSLVRTGVLLNGGALVSLPAVFSMFSLDARSIAFSVTLTACLFAGGLTCSWLAAFAGFFALKNLGRSFRSKGRAIRERLAEEHYPGDVTRYSPPEARRLDIRADRSRRRARQLTALVVTLCSASLALFLAGGIYGARVIQYAPQKVPTVTLSPKS
jgi:hypothetical protein